MARQKPLPYYRWYVQDYRASRNANALTWQQRGIYRELLDECWVEGCIPDDAERLAEIARVPLGVMAEAWPTLRKLFTPADGLDGVFVVSRRLEIERSIEDADRVKKSMAGRKGGLAKAGIAKHRQAGETLTQASSSEQFNSEKSSSSESAAAAGPLGGSASASSACVSCGYPAGDHALTCPEVLGDWRDHLDDAPPAKPTPTTPILRRLA